MAAAVVILLAFLSLGTLPAQAAEDGAAVTVGHLDWGFKQSWRNYVGAAGTQVIEGASQNDDGTFRFPILAGTVNAESGITDIQFSGGVHFQSYCTGEGTDRYCQLDSTMSNFRVVISAAEQSIYADIQSRARNDASGTLTDYGSILLARLDVSGATTDSLDGTSSWSGIIARLAESPAPQATSYPQGSALDAVAFSYEGILAVPSFEESWDQPGVPRLQQQEAWYSTSKTREDFRAAVSDDGVMIVASTVSLGAGQVYALDTNSMEQIGNTVSLTAGYVAGYIVEPSIKTVFYYTASASNQPATMHALQLRGDEFEDTIVGSIDERGSYIHGIAWDNTREELVVITRVSTTENNFYRFTANNGEWGRDVIPLPVIPTTEGRWNGANNLINYYGDTAYEGFVAVGDGSYLIARTKSVRLTVDGVRTDTYLPVLHLKVEGSTVTVSEVPDSVPLETGQGNAYAAVRSLGDNRYAVYTPSPGSARILRFGEIQDGEFRWTSDVIKDFAHLGRIVPSAYPGISYASDKAGQSVLVFKDSVLAAEFPITGGYYSTTYSFQLFAAGPNGEAFVQVADAEGYVGIAKMASIGLTPTVTRQPGDVQVTVPLGQSDAAAELSVVAEASPAASVQWQVKTPGDSLFRDVPGATGLTLVMEVGTDGNGNQYRAVLSNAAGAVASDIATLTVKSAPLIVQQPVSATASEGGSVTLAVLASGNPDPTVTWQLQSGEGTWIDVAGAGFAADDARLTITGITAAQDGTLFRAQITNEVATVYSNEVTLSVVSAPEEDTTYTGVAFEWTGSVEMQHQPPNASTANYFSAGVSDGTEASYSPSSSEVEVIQRDGSGGEAPATWATRGLHIDRGGSAAQLVRLTDGTAEVRADGSAIIEWPGSFSVNFYDGLVPFTLSDLVLEVAVDGTGTLKADLAGYSGDMEHPDAPKEPVAPVAGVTVATFSGVVVDPEHGFVVTPNYAGVQITVPSGATVQKRDVSGWGSWPQGFVDFQQTTGLAAYFYTTGGIFDANKTPSPFTVGFDGATIPAVAPTIIAQPGSVSVAAGADASFSASASGYPTPTVQWQSKLAGAGDWVNIPGATATSYVARGVDKGASGTQYRAVFTNSEGTATTDAATLTVAAPPVVKPAATDAGYLSWGVRGSFRDYITGPIAKGSISLSGGASTSGGAFRFGQSDSSWNAETGTGTADYGGAVRFYGHSGVLDVTLSNPSITVNSASSATLYVSANGSRIAIGNVNLAAASKSDITGGVAYSGAPVTLTAAGASVFSYGSSQFYAPGTAMDSVTFVIGANASGGGGGGTIAAFQADEWTPPATPPATTGIEGDPAALADVHAGRELTVWADGFQPNEEGIKVVVYSEPIVLESNLTADATGRATWTGIIPAELEPGEHTLTFQGSVNRGLVLDVKAAQQLEGCTVEDATLSWGFKESFRAYIDGSIANGEWTVSDGATYETPLFGWSGGTGVYDIDTATGQVDFTGSIRFTGHDGLLDTTVANPRLQFVDENTAYLLLDVAGVTMEDALAGKTDPVVVTAVPFVKLDLSGDTVKLSEDGTTLTGTDVPTAITAQGYEAFPNYEAGTAFDPVSFTVTVGSDCTTALPATGEDQAPATEPVSADGPDLAWLWWVIGALVLAAIIAAVIVLLRRRRLAAEGAETHQG